MSHRAKCNRTTRRNRAQFRRPRGTPTQLSADHRRQRRQQGRLHGRAERTC